MKYKTGMFGGAFEPLHNGHIHVIIKAAAQCERLYIVLSYSRKRDVIPMELRYRWIKNAFAHLTNLEIILLEDEAENKTAYDLDDYWEKGRDFVLRQIGAPVDVVFCGSDYAGSNRYEQLYGCKVVYFDRAEVPVCSTEIRENPFAFWEYIPAVCRPYFVRRILFVGGESTGKSTLTQNLALAFQTNYLEEIGRDICDFAGSEDLMIAEDFVEILLRHKTKEMDAVKQSNRLLFVDTDALTTRFYAEFLLGEESKGIGKLADAIAAMHRFDLVFFLEPTVKFVQDGTRNPKIEAEREKYSLQLKELLDRAGIGYICLDGDYLSRFEDAQRIIKERYRI